MNDLFVAWVDGLNTDNGVPFGVSVAVFDLLSVAPTIDADSLDAVNDAVECTDGYCYIEEGEFFEDRDYTPAIETHPRDISSALAVVNELREGKGLDPVDTL